MTRLQWEIAQAILARWDVTVGLRSVGGADPGFDIPDQAFHGFDGLIGKPFKPAELARAVRDVIRSQTMHPTYA